MKRAFTWFMAVALVAAAAAPALAQEGTLDKIKRTGVLTIGTRTGSPPFAFINKSNEWVGFSIDLVEQLVKPAVEKEVGKAIKVEKKESTPPTRIPLLASNAVDLIAGTMTDTPQRRESVDFSLTFFYTGAQFLVKKGSALKALDPNRLPSRISTCPRRAEAMAVASSGNEVPTATRTDPTTISGTSARSARSVAPATSSCADTRTPTSPPMTFSATWRALRARSRARRCGGGGRRGRTRAR